MNKGNDDVTIHFVDNEYLSWSEIVGVQYTLNHLFMTQLFFDQNLKDVDECYLWSKIVDPQCMLNEFFMTLIFSGRPHRS